MLFFRDFVRRFLEKNGNLVLDKLDWVFEGCVIRFIECLFWLLYNFCIIIYRDGYNLVFCRLRYCKGELVCFWELGIKVRCKLILIFMILLNNFFKIFESDWEWEFCWFYEWIRIMLLIKVLIYEFWWF